ncbi:hypothetical protein [Olsenella sp. HMSC062G07]|uniref:hypothetical protein n=1 Tax=Olsenella sp. HMSC062G07 TaxID=1739330 RepID=UPI0008A3B2B5|nr:hypothetical protein [Olsenella sp. HMSC062G07]OFK25055.1 hypothetical protein HMPREF2826_00265 [Olsenella sp. HMSC062G07]
MPEVSQRDVAEMWYRRYQEVWRDYERLLGEVRRLRASAPDVQERPMNLVRCRDCKYLDTMRCPIKRSLVYDGASTTAVVAPGGFCAWGQPREDK